MSDRRGAQTQAEGSGRVRRAHPVLALLFVKQTSPDDVAEVQPVTLADAKVLRMPGTCMGGRFGMRLSIETFWARTVLLVDKCALQKLHQECALTASWPF